MKILFSNFDKSVICFLQKFQQNSLLTNVNVCIQIHDHTDLLLQIVTNLMPLFTNINSIGIFNPDVLDQLQCEYSELAIPMFTSVLVLLA
jgi:hypothetical protein